MDEQKDPYDWLPIAVRSMVSRREYQFMTDRQKEDLIENLTMPEPTEDY